MNNWKLFTYAIKYDTGFAPNPFHGICTLNTCKPQIRREADIGDWVVGLKKDRVIFVMEVTKKISMSDYWKLCKTDYPKKIPDQSGIPHDPILLCGDCQYDFSGHTLKLLKGLHGQSNVKTDLSGKNTLISENFIYFGSKVKKLPKNLLPIAKYSNGIWIGQARKSKANLPFRDQFLKWVKTLPCSNKAVLAKPSDDRFEGRLKWNVTAPTSVCTGRS